MSVNAFRKFKKKLFISAFVFSVTFLRCPTLLIKENNVKHVLYVKK